MDEGRVFIGGFETWYGVARDPAGPDSRELPVLALHGGPGLPTTASNP